MTEAFTPHPGSRLDATAQAAAHEMPAEQIETPSGDPEIVVPVITVLPELGRGYVVVLSANNLVLPLLPQDPRRRSATVLAVDNDVYIAPTREAVQGSAGAATGTGAFYLPKGIPMPVPAKGAWYTAATTSASQSRVSVLVCTDGE